MAGPDFQVFPTSAPNEPLKIGNFKPTGALSIAAGLEEGSNQLEEAAKFYQADQDKLGKFKALTALDTAQTEAAERLQQMKVDAKPGAQGLTKDFRDEKDKIFAPAKALIPPKFAPELNYHAAQLENNLSQQAFSTEMQARDQYYKDTLSNTLNDKLNSIDANPDNFWNAQRNAVQMIEAAGITTTDKEHILRGFQSSSETALFNKIKEKDPEKAMVAIGGKVKITNPDKLFVINRIKTMAKEYGMEDYADVAVAVAAQESSFKVDEGSTTTGVQGIFQLDKASRDLYGYKPGVEGNISAGLGDMRSRIEAFKKDFGRAPTPNEYYIYHYQGIGGGKAILQADPNASMFDTLAKTQGSDYAAKVFRQNPWLDPKSTNAQYIAWSAQVVNNRLYQTGGKYNPDMDIADPTFKHIAYDTRLKLRDASETEFTNKETRDYQVTHNLESETRERSFNEAVTLFRQDKLTPEYVDAHAEDLGPAKALELDRLLKAEDKAGNYDATTHADIMSKAWAITNPADATDVIKQAMTARADKKISKEDYRTIEALVNKSQSDGIARGNLVGINSEAIKSNFIARTNDPAYVNKAKASAQADVEYKKWALEHPNATTDDHSTKVAEIIRGAKLSSVGITPSTNLRSIVPILGDRTPQSSSEADLYKALSVIQNGKAATLVKQRAAKSNEDRADLSRKVLALNTQGQRIKDILEWKNAPFDQTKFDEFNKPVTTDKVETPKPVEAAAPKALKSSTTSTTGKPTPSQREAESNFERVNLLGNEEFFTQQHEERKFTDPAYSARVIREELEQQYYNEERKTIKSEFQEEMKTTPVEEAFTVRTKYNKLLEERANAKVEEALKSNKNYAAEIGLARNADEVYTAEYLRAKNEYTAKKGLNVVSATTRENQFKEAGNRAKRAYILRERQK